MWDTGAFDVLVVIVRPFPPLKCDAKANATKPPHCPMDELERRSGTKTGCDPLGIEPLTIFTFPRSFSRSGGGAAFLLHLFATALLLVLHCHYPLIVRPIAVTGGIAISTSTTHHRVARGTVHHQGRRAGLTIVSGSKSNGIEFVHFPPWVSFRRTSSSSVSPLNPNNWNVSRMRLCANNFIIRHRETDQTRIQTTGGQVMRRRRLL